MFIKMFYGPEKPRIGCDMKFVIEFMKPYSSELYETQVHYDILRVDIIDGYAESLNIDKFDLAIDCHCSVM